MLHNTNIVPKWSMSVLKKKYKNLTDLTVKNNNNKTTVGQSLKRSWHTEAELIINLSSNPSGEGSLPEIM